MTQLPLLPCHLSPWFPGPVALPALPEQLLPHYIGSLASLPLAKLQSQASLLPSAGHTAVASIATLWNDPVGMRTGRSGLPAIAAGLSLVHSGPHLAEAPNLQLDTSSIARALGLAQPQGRGTRCSPVHSNVQEAVRRVRCSHRK